MKDIDIAELVSWALVDQQAAYFCELPRENTKALMSSTAIVTGTLALGVQVDCQPGFLKRMGARCHPDAMTVYEAIKSLPDHRMRTLVLAHGMARTQPDWDIWPEIRPKRHPKNGKVVVESSYDRAGNLVAQWCPLDVFPSWELVEAARESYERWRAGLVFARAILSNRLFEHIATGPSAEECPWIYV